ncbi:MAG: hypothetical protein HYU36_04255 [Planctomycetes bacterium]|nr:hypothetical protein [Planctomycetota bacterium]
MSPIGRFRQKLQEGRLCLGVGITFTDPLVSEALAQSVDFLWYDMEHSPMSPEALSAHMLAARSRGTPAIVRVTGSDTAFIKPVLDAGADGIVVPQVRSVEEVRKIVSDCRYAPQGRRGCGPRVPSNYGREPLAGFFERANREVFVSVMLETAEALSVLDDLLEIPGLDSLVLGPVDLSSALGVLGQVEHPKVVAATEVVIARTRAAGLWIGSGLGPDPDTACVLVRRGVQWLQIGSDFGYLIRDVDEVVKRVREHAPQS